MLNLNIIYPLFMFKYLNLVINLSLFILRCTHFFIMNDHLFFVPHRHAIFLLQNVLNITCFCLIDVPNLLAVRILSIRKFTGILNKCSNSMHFVVRPLACIVILIWPYVLSYSCFLVILVVTNIFPAIL